MGQNRVGKSAFFDFLNRYSDTNFQTFLESAEQDIDYINWHGYCLIMAYGDEASEYNAVRNTCALFDASPVKKYKITGLDAGAFLDAVLTRQVSRIEPMRVAYAVLCNKDGMLLDDGLLYKFADDNYLLMISEIDHEDHFGTVSNRFGDLEIEEVTPSLSGLALQGPKSCAVLGSMGFVDMENISPFEIRTLDFCGGEIIIARVGFTADLGYELWFKPELNKAVQMAITRAEAALNIQIAGYGLTALNALRLEGGFIVPGWETAQAFEDDEHERTPAELGISWTVDLGREDDFIGKDALLKEKENGPRFKTLGVAIDRQCNPEDQIELYATIDGCVRQVGTLPSVAWSYGLNCGLALASVKSDFSDDDLDYHLQISGERVACRVVNLPFVKFDRYRRTPVSV